MKSTCTITVSILTLLMTFHSTWGAKDEPCTSAELHQILLNNYTSVIYPKGRYPFLLDRVAIRRSALDSLNIQKVIGKPLDFETTAALLLEVSGPELEESLLKSLQRLESRKVQIKILKDRPLKKAEFNYAHPKLHPFHPDLVSKRHLHWPITLPTSQSEVLDALNKLIELLAVPDFRPVRQLTTLVHLPGRFIGDNLDAMTEKLLRQAKVLEARVQLIPDTVIPKPPQLGRSQRVAEGLLRTYLFIPIAKPFAQVTGITIDSALLKILHNEGAPGLRRFLTQNYGPGLSLRYSFTLFTSLNAALAVSITAIVFSKYPVILDFLERMTDFDFSTEEGWEQAALKLQEYLRNPRKLISELRNECQKAGSPSEVTECLALVSKAETNLIELISDATEGLLDSGPEL